MRNRLIIFTRFPEPGKTKTRLIPHLGEDGAAQLQKEMTEYAIKQARKTNAEIEVRYTGGSLQQLRVWLGDDLQYAEQGDGDLGERMERAFAEHFAAGVQRILIIGSDCPSNNWKNMEAAFESLEQSDCVIGPANDGGYYLIGLSISSPPLFHKIDWGGNRVFVQTMMAAGGLSIVQLPMLPDVDVSEDIPSRISVIIPTLNEEMHLPAALKKIREGFNIEIIVVDGGSTDGTRSVFPAALECKNGRAAQQNRGAEKATGKLFLFLHADTELPDGWDWIVRETLADDTVALGAFTFKVRESFPGKKFIEETANWRSNKGQLPFGDQGLFLRKTVFEKAGGFPDMPIMEDYAFVRSLRRLGRIITVSQATITSGRRWQQHGAVKVTLVNKLMILGYHLGLSPNRLATFYRRS